MEPSDLPADLMRLSHLLPPLTVASMDSMDPWDPWDLPSPAPSSTHISVTWKMPHSYSRPIITNTQGDGKEKWDEKEHIARINAALKRMRITRYQPPPKASESSTFSTELATLAQDGHIQEASRLEPSHSTDSPTRSWKILNQSGESCFPDEIFTSGLLTHLELNGNQINAVPATIGLLSSLTYLDLGQNLLDHFPLELANCIQLETLILSFNPLRKIPLAICALVNLKILWLVNCNLEELNIGRSTRLQELYIDSNSLTRLPSGIGSLSQLEVLSASHNKIDSFPEELCLCTRIRSLILSANKLSTLHPNIMQLSQLQELSLETNTLGPLPKKIWEFFRPIKKFCIDLPDAASEEIDLDPCYK